MPWKTLCGFPPTSDTVTLRIPNGAWRPDTVITDYEGTEMFVLLDQTQEMRSYEAVFGDLEGRRLLCIKRHVVKAFWKDGYYFCTYKPNYPHQKPLNERDVDNKKVYPFSYLQVNPMKGRFFYRLFDNQEGLGVPKMRADNPWLGFMVVCCTPMVRCGRWTASFQRRSTTLPTIYVDQWRNCVDVGPGNDLLAALAMAYVFDRYQCQPLVTVFGLDNDNEELEPDDKSISSHGEADPLAGIGDYGRRNGGGGGPGDGVDEYGQPYGQMGRGDQDVYLDEEQQQQQQPYYDDVVVDENNNGQVYHEGEYHQPGEEEQYYTQEDGGLVDAPPPDLLGGDHPEVYDEQQQQQYHDDDAQEQQQQFFDEQQQVYDDGQHFDAQQVFDDGQHYDEQQQQVYDDDGQQQYYDENGQEQQHQHYDGDGQEEQQQYTEDGQFTYQDDNNSYPQDQQTNKLV